MRVTGGEPLVRKGVEQLVKGLKAIPGIRKVTMTTNAVLLEQQLPALLEAGLDSVNISLDSWTPPCLQRSRPGMNLPPCRRASMPRWKAAFRSS